MNAASAPLVSVVIPCCHEVTPIDDGWLVDVAA